jgi:A/G-specific adenine glycosylase
VAFWVVRADGAVLLRRRAENGLLGGMMEIPSTEWRGDAWTDRAARAAAPIRADWRRIPGVIAHGFTHFRLELEVMCARVADGAGADGLWCTPARFGEHALPTHMKKVVRHALVNAKSC